MIITVDLDSDHWEDIRTTILAGICYGLKIIRVSKSYSKKGYHIVFQTHHLKVKDIDLIFDVPREIREVIKNRVNHAKELGITDKTLLLRVALGDDINRVFYDMCKRPELPEQVLFVKYKWRWCRWELI